MISTGDSKIGTATWNCQYHTQILTVQILSEWNCAEEFTCAIFQYNIVDPLCRSPPLFPSKKMMGVIKKEQWNIQRGYMSKSVYCLCGSGGKTKVSGLHKKENKR